MSDVVADIMTLVQNICEEENLRVTVSGSIRSGAAACAGAVAGCLLAGPWGGVPGAAIGAAISAGTGKDFKPLWKVIAEWPEEKKQQLAEKIKNIMRRVDARHVAALGAMAMAAPALRAEIVTTILAYCQNAMGLQIAGR